MAVRASLLQVGALLPGLRNSMDFAPLRLHLFCFTIEPHGGIASTWSNSSSFSAASSYTVEDRIGWRGRKIGTREVRGGPTFWDSRLR